MQRHTQAQGKKLDGEEGKVENVKGYTIMDDYLLPFGKQRQVIKVINCGQSSATTEAWACFSLDCEK